MTSQCHKAQNIINHAAGDGNALSNGQKRDGNRRVQHKYPDQSRHDGSGLVRRIEPNSILLMTKPSVRNSATSWCQSNGQCSPFLVSQRNSSTVPHYRNQCRIPPALESSDKTGEASFPKHRRRCNHTLKPPGWAYRSRCNRRFWQRMGKVPVGAVPWRPGAEQCYRRRNLQQWSHHRSFGCLHCGFLSQRGSSGLSRMSWWRPWWTSCCWDCIGKPC